MAGRAWAENAVIISDDGATVRFHPQCPKCGRVESSVTGQGHCLYGISNVGYFTCYKCMSSIPVVLHRE